VSRESAAWRRAVQAYCRARGRESLTRTYKRRIRSILLRVGSELENSGLACRPEHFGKRQQEFVKRHLWPVQDYSSHRLAHTTVQLYSVILSAFLLAHGRNFRFFAGQNVMGQASRHRLALGERQVNLILQASRKLDTHPRALVAFELTMGLRRNEVLRLRASEVRGERLHLPSRRGGRERWAPMSREVRSLVPRLMSRRKELVERTGLADQDYLLCHVWGGQMRGMSKSWADNAIRRLFSELGIKIDGNLHHALRRAFGRSLLTRHVPLEVVGDLLGHENLAATRVYLGIRGVDRTMSSSSIL
jgi:site-specific recombinase XerD